MNPDALILIIAFAGGTLTGSFIGMLIAGMFTARKLRAHERETWRSARIYFHKRYNLEDA